VAKPSGRNLKPSVVSVGRLFFPQSQSLGIDRGDCSPAVQQKIVYAGANNGSFDKASRDLAELAEWDVSAKQVERVCERIGAERCAERDEAVRVYQDKPLVQRKRVPEGVSTPAVAAVSVDGGRLQIWERTATTAAPSTSSTPAQPVPLSSGTATTEEDSKSTYWREDKIGLLMRLKSEQSTSDPCPEIPEHFVDPTRILQLARELKKQPALGEDGVRDSAEPEVAQEALHEEDQTWEPPEVLAKGMLGSRCTWPEFGPKLAQAAWSWGFYGAPRKAFVADGSENNWTIWREHFSSFVAVLDFIHALSYVFAAAMAGRKFAEGWPCYVQWITWTWQGQVEQVIAALAARQLELGVPTSEEGETSPRNVVAQALGYLQNHKERMRYPEYRRQGLPITSSYVESAVKQFNQRVKGTEKFWSEEGAEAILQLRADYLSDDEPLTGFWQRRQNGETGQRRYRRVA
jgi:hypothetical protein